MLGIIFKAILIFHSLSCRQRNLQRLSIKQKNSRDLGAQRQFIRYKPGSQKYLKPSSADSTTMIDFYRAKPHRFWFLTGLGLHLAVAWFSLGFLHPDGQYQIIAPLHLKLIGGALDSLTWDFQYQIRPWFQIFLYFPFAKILHIGGANPFEIDLYLRTLTSLFSFGALSWLGYVFFQDKAHEKKVRWCQFLALTWFLPMLQIRTSSENLSTAFMFLSMGILQQTQQRQAFFGAGLLAGFSFLVRYQMGVVALALLFWLALVRRQHLPELSLFSLGVLLCLPLGIVVDYWGYGEWTSSAWHYFYQNIVLDKASNWGVMPWYFYFAAVLEKGIPPVSLIFLGGFLLFVWRFPKHIATTAALSFLLVHTIIGHKEVRFLIFIYQMVPLFLAHTYRPQWWSPYFWGINCLALTISPFFPLSNHTFQRWLYNQSTTIHVEIESNGRHLTIPRPYKNPLTRLQPVPDLKNAYGWVLTSQIRQFRIMEMRNDCRLIRSHYPTLLLQEKYNFFKWNTRSSVWAMWECSP